MTTEQKANRLETIAEMIEEACYPTQAGELAAKSLDDKVGGRIIGAVLTEVVERLIAIMVEVRRAA